jgi:hypothetical protein
MRLGEWLDGKSFSPERSARPAEPADPLWEVACIGTNTQSGSDVHFGTIAALMFGKSSITSASGLVAERDDPAFLNERAIRFGCARWER